MKLTKAASKAHQEANELVDSDRDLTFDERRFIVENWQPGAESNITDISAFFTPWNLAQHMALETLNASGPNDTVVTLDLFAGIGTLSLAVEEHHGYGNRKFICIEGDPNFIRVGKRVMPQATWIRTDGFGHLDYEADEVICNPPYGRGKSSHLGPHTRLEWLACVQAMRLAPIGTVLMPQSSAPFTYSGKSQFTETWTNDHDKLRDAGIELMPNCGIDTTLIEGFRDSGITTEIVCIERIEEG